MTRLNLRVNTLDLKESVALGEWMKSNQAQIIFKDKVAVADDATKALGFTVTAANVDRVAKVYEIDFRTSIEGASMGKQVFVAKALRDLMHVLGQPVPKYLDSLCSNSSLEEIITLYNKR